MKTINLKSGEYEITLLAKKEYELYRDRIPLFDNWWWLRSPGLYSNYVAYVLCCGDILNYGGIVGNSYGIRPALKSKALNLPIGESFAALGNRRVMIDNGLAISEDVITHRRYDSESNVWETSELKTWLESWAKEGEDNDNE